MMRWIAACSLTFLFSCSDVTPESGGPHPLPGSDAKADNYITSSAREFDLSGEAVGILPEDFHLYSEERKISVAASVAKDRYGEIRSSVDMYIQDRLADANGAGADWRTLWGVFAAPPEDWKYSMYWRGYHANLNEVIEYTDTTVRFRFTMGFLGSSEFYNFLTDDKADSRSFPVRLPETLVGVRETIDIEMERSGSQDAFPRYDVLFADGVFDIGVHLGGDYNAERYDQVRGRWFVNEYLLEEGWVSTTGVTSFDELTLDSGPFIRDLIIEGKPVQARIYITHADMSDTEDGEGLIAAVKESYKSRDVVIYAGHAGPNHGLTLDYHPRVDLGTYLLSSIEMRDEYQIFMYQGCQTYQTLVGDVLENPDKTYDNVDVITTFNSTPFAAGYTVLQGLSEWLTLTTDSGDHYPVSWMRILDRFNRGAGETVIYGVHGVDQDPQINPNGSEGVACTPCDSDDQCIGGGNFCLQFLDGAACGVACTTDEACGPNFTCEQVFSADLIHMPKQCLPVFMSCETAQGW